MSTLVRLENVPSLVRDDLRARLEQAVAGYSDEELLWASGYLAGLAARTNRKAGDVQPVRAPTEAPRPATNLTILYGSQTGNGKALAQLALEQSRAVGISARLVSLADFNPRQLKQERAILLVVSTHGDGDPPDDAQALHRYVLSAQVPRLERLSFAVLALGDSSYPYFCKTGRDFDERLEALGAHRIADREDCDLDYKTVGRPWVESTIKAFGTVLADSASPARIALVEPTRSVAAAPDSDPELLETEATVLVNQRLTGRGSSKDVRHVEFALDDERFQYQAGDSVAVVATNPPDLVAEILDLTQWDERADVRLGDTTLDLKHALQERVELTLLSRPVLAAIAIQAQQGSDLQSLLDSGDTGALAAYMRERQVVDVLRETGAALTPQAFIDLARPLATRSYSIASSRVATPDELHLTVAVVKDTHNARSRVGCASNFLANLEAGGSARLRLEPNQSFRLPHADAAPILMIGPGTGVAPFRAFVEERAARGAPGRNWLFFGERTQREDFLYQLEWQRHLRQGTLHRLEVAFSRDGERKHYVQDRLRACAREVYAWLQEGAHLYVCGDAQRMAKDVHAALIEIVTLESGLASEAAEEYLFELKQQGRYQRDVY